MRTKRQDEACVVVREILGDLLTPVRAYGLLNTSGEPGFLLESVESGERLGRYSYVGVHPTAIDLGEGDPLPAVTQALEGTKMETGDGPSGFNGGLVGYLGYEAATHFERLPQAKGAAPGLPANFFLRVQTLAVFDHVRRTLQLLTVRMPGEETGQAESRLDEAEARLQGQWDRETKPDGVKAEWESNTSEEEFCANVRQVKEYIQAGDCFQVVLSQRWRKPLRARPFDIYRALRTVNPSPYMFFIDLGQGRVLAGASPEVLLKLEGRKVTVRPLAGTRPRGRSEEEDSKREKELLADSKERAEHLMLVDLGRNDIGRVAQIGSVQVERLMSVERYSHVMHLSSTVTGRLAEGKTGLEALRSAFPAGTVSGAPKIRAMEIIAALESEQRGVYAGACGLLGFDGSIDMAITLRTVVVADGMAYIQAGAGIVADSEPQGEYQETLQKSGAMMEAVAQAEVMA